MSSVMESAGDPLLERNGAPKKPRALESVKPPQINTEPQLQLAFRLKPLPIGKVWLLVVSWTAQLYLVYNSAGMMKTIKADCLVLLASSLFFMALSTGLMITELEWISQFKWELMGILQHLMETLQLSLQRFAALLLLLNNTFLTGSALKMDTQNKVTSENVSSPTSGPFTMEEFWYRNVSDQVASASLCSDPSGISCLAYYLHYLTPAVVYMLDESEPIWKKQRAAGFLYSVFLLLTLFDSLLCYFSFNILYFTTMASSQSGFLLNGPKLVLSLYVSTQLFSSFFCVCVRIFLHERFEVMPSTVAPCQNGVSKTSLVVKVKARRQYSQGLSILVTSAAVCFKLPLIVELFVLYKVKSELSILLIWAFQAGHCQLCVLLCFIMFLCQRCFTPKRKLRRKRRNVGSCLANSFIFRSSRNVEEWRMSQASDGSK